MTARADRNTKQVNKKLYYVSLVDPVISFNSVKASATSWSVRGSIVPSAMAEIFSNKMLQRPGMIIFMTSSLHFASYLNELETSMIS